MYRVDEHDELLELEGVPPSSAGAPMPVVLADERRVVLAYLVQERELWQEGPAVSDTSSDSTEEPAALVEFILPRAHLFGSPNDEALRGHPLHERGLRAYAAYEVRHSSWVRGLEQMNRVHSAHAPARFALLRHYLFTFHDSTFECVAEGLQVSRHEWPRQRLLAEMQRRLDS